MEPVKMGMKDQFGIVMSDLGNRYAAGIQLTGMENNIAQMVTGMKVGDSYGTSPRDMTVTPETLPETVKGTLASYAS